MSYDNYLNKLIDEYTKGCQPEYIEPPTIYSSGEINCQTCDNIDCIYYKDYNNYE